MQFWFRARNVAKSLPFYRSKRTFKEFQNLSRKRLQTEIESTDLHDKSEMQRAKKRNLVNSREYMPTTCRKQLRELDHLKNVEDILQTFHSAQTPDAVLFSKTLDRLTKVGAPDMALQLWSKCQKEIVLTESCFGAVLNSIATMKNKITSRHVKFAEKTWQHMTNFTDFREPDAANFCIMLRIYGIAKSRKGLTFWESMPSEKRDTYNYTAMIRLCNSCEEYEKACLLFDEMLDRGHEASVLAFTTTMNSYTGVKDKHRGLAFTKRFQSWCAENGHNFWEQPLFLSAMMNFFLQHDDFDTAHRFIQALEAKSDWIRQGSKNSVASTIYDKYIVLAEKASHTKIADKTFEKCIKSHYFDLEHYSTCKNRSFRNDGKKQDRVDFHVLSPMTAVVGFRYLIRKIFEQSQIDASVLDSPLVIQTGIGKITNMENHQERYSTSRSALEEFINVNPFLKVDEHIYNRDKEVVGFVIGASDLQKYFQERQVAQFTMNLNDENFVE